LQQQQSLPVQVDNHDNVLYFRQNRNETKGMATDTIHLADDRSGDDVACLTHGGQETSHNACVDLSYDSIIEILFHQKRQRKFDLYFVIN
jgi:hypothetical protein